MLPASVRAHIEQETGSRVVSGGMPRVSLANGMTLFVKSDPGAPRGMYSTEASGLARLRATKALRVPDVVAVAEAGEGPAFIALELVEGARPSRTHDEDLGRGLARIHRVTSSAFGLDEENFIAVLPQANAPLPDWPSFYRDRRLAPLVRRALDRGLLPARIRDRFDDLFSRIDALAKTNDPPALLHGDLWGGNAITDERGAPCLIDPSVYFGNREIDLAMMKLFGGFGAQVFRAYAAEYPLEPGHEQRVSLYQLYPLLVHVHLFGGGYVSQLESALAAGIGED